MRESKRVENARGKRCDRLAAKFHTWQENANQRLYPESLHEIIWAALRREYQLGQGTASKIIWAAIRHERQLRRKANEHAIVRV